MFPARASRPKRGDLLFGNIDTFLVWQSHRRPARHGRHQRQPHPIDEPGNARLGRRKCSPPSAFPTPMLPRIRSSSEVYGDGRAMADLAGVPMAGILGDQQAALVGQSLLPRRRSQEHVWHRMFSADEHGRASRASSIGLADHRGVQVGGEPGALCARRQRGDHRRAGAVDARQLRADLDQRGDRAAGAHGGRQRRRVLRARLLRPLRAVLERHAREA